MSIPLPPPSPQGARPVAPGAPMPPSVPRPQAPMPPSVPRPQAPMPPTAFRPVAPGAPMPPSVPRPVAPGAPMAPSVPRPVAPGAPMAPSMLNPNVAATIPLSATSAPQAPVRTVLLGSANATRPISPVSSARPAMLAAKPTLAASVDNSMPAMPKATIGISSPKGFSKPAGFAKAVEEDDDAPKKENAIVLTIAIVALLCCSYFGYIQYQIDQTSTRITHADCLFGNPLAAVAAAGDEDVYDDSSENSNDDSDEDSDSF